GENQKRRGIVHELSLSPASIKQLARHQALTLPAIHKHLKILENAGLIIRRKAGRTNFITLNPGTLGLAQVWISQYQTQWGSAGASFENYTSGMGS
ncbi:winged helix-turn-helix domain-containing protein, partial [Candidatus Saccharibacteria bacterium]|nr:winged helix-turn-helix domain-containing protein [Candidatus Saccharibacteria bacterium]